MSLFDAKAKEESPAPLALRMRPRTPEEFIGQQHFFGEGKLLWRMLKADRLASVIFYGPPGCGKTSLAHVIAQSTRAQFEQINAAESNVAQVRTIIAQARKRREIEGTRTVLFVDELHRFNKAQQDVLLPDVEEGTLVLIGATTHNPFFSINAPLVSRSQIFEFKPLTGDDVKGVVRMALADKERGLGGYQVQISDEALEFLAAMSDGDARRALNALEIGVLTTQADAGGVIHYTLAVAEDSIQRKAIVYDHDEDAHYDAASAFIKSMRGSDPDAAIYWLAKMLEAGEDPRFIARRIVICAAEDVGNAAPMALVLAAAALEVSEFVGMPEARIPLAQAVTYIATAPKSNAAYMAIDKALADVREGRTMPVPEHLRDSHYPGAKRLGHGEGYKYAHEYDEHFVAQDYTPEPRIYYEPTENGHEAEIKKRLEAWRKRRQEEKPAKE
ncbi:MAG TPA: replication-associated recombination protein A [Planctomycetota bacterium]|nr:replication-associated recombination protein A [Planctomycetota bacterium]